MSETTPAPNPPGWIVNPTSAEGLNWFALRVTPQHEKAVFRELIDLAANPFCPVAARWVRLASGGKAKRKVRRQYALLATYVFIGFDDAPDFSVVDDVAAIRGFVCFDSQEREPSTIRREQIQSLMDRQARGVFDTPDWEANTQRETISYRAGDKVRVDLPGQSDQVFEVMRVRNAKHILRGLGLLGKEEITVSDPRRMELVTER
ncbi:transcription termination/antitermination NusG family protein [Thalassobaculum litoreum]|uniref:Transcription antitermination factor NusG n=1 Tax=Thalassobaculum litoreum DSM 18839 TaxID=1123362 RepID=A0A8G2EYW4_9PROT|nr:transcription termination/antitermination NusG family protein [Thalassobaculum litoreum]SDF82994.1 Transcription antitermination factor NusG [Thalassobaculum litoreum DSM 18839]